MTSHGAAHGIHLGEKWCADTRGQYGGGRVGVPVVLTPPKERDQGTQSRIRRDTADLRSQLQRPPGFVPSSGHQVSFPPAATRFSPPGKGQSPADPSARGIQPRKDL